jgi:hypothetical protein
VDYGITVVHWSTMDRAMASGTEHAGDGHAACSGAQELDVSTLGERGDRGGPYRLQKGAEELWIWVRRW